MMGPYFGGFAPKIRQYHGRIPQRSPKNLRWHLPDTPGAISFNIPIVPVFELWQLKGKFQVWQEVWQRIPKAELANIPRIF